MTMCSPLASPTRCDVISTSMPGRAASMISFSVMAVPEGASSLVVWWVSVMENL